MHPQWIIFFGFEIEYEVELEKEFWFPPYEWKSYIKNSRDQKYSIGYYNYGDEYYIYLLGTKISIDAPGVQVIDLNNYFKKISSSDIKEFKKIL